MYRITRHLTVSLATAAALAAAAVPASSQGVPPGAPEPATITYVGSSGFLIRAGGRKILIDALYDGFPGAYVVPASVQQPLLAGRPPFDGVDLILATHSHGDHFSAAAVRRALESSPGAVFVGPASAVAELGGVGDRAMALEVPEGQRRSLEVRGISIVAMRFSHGTPPAGRPGIVNLAYLITVGGVKFLHTGDVSVNDIPLAYLQSLGVPDERVDVAFVPHFLLSTPVPIPWVTEGLRPRVVVASHLEYTGDSRPNAELIRRNFPTAVVFSTEGESWVVR